MSRCLSRPVNVQCDSEGVPVSILTGWAVLPVCAVVDNWREWFGVLFGERKGRLTQTRIWSIQPFGAGRPC